MDKIEKVDKFGNTISYNSACSASSIIGYYIDKKDNTEYPIILSYWRGGVYIDFINHYYNISSTQFVVDISRDVCAEIAPSIPCTYKSILDNIQLFSDFLKYRYNLFTKSTDNVIMIDKSIAVDLL